MATTHLAAAEPVGDVTLLRRAPPRSIDLVLDRLVARASNWPAASSRGPARLWPGAPVEHHLRKLGISSRQRAPRGARRAGLSELRTGPIDGAHSNAG
jgi:hypothetical protein